MPQAKTASEQGTERGEQFMPEIRRARFDRLTIYEVAESELVILERGSADSIYLNFAVALLSLAVSLTVSLSTATLPSQNTFVVFVVVAVVGYVVGTILLALWWRTRASVSACVRTVRSRLPPQWLGDSSVSDDTGGAASAEQSLPPDAPKAARG